MAEGRVGASTYLADELDAAAADATAAATAAGEEAPGFAHDSGCAFCERPDCPARGDLLAVRRPCFVGYLPLKNAAKWRKCQTYGALYVGDLFLPIKLPSDFEPDADHTVAALVRAHPRVRCVVDLTNHCSSVYSCEGTPVVHEKLMLTSKVVPTDAEVREFNRRVNEFLVTAPADAIIAAHCHYSFNRTGFMIVAFLRLERGMELAEALDQFQRSRPPGIKHKWFVHELRRRYGSDADREGLADDGAVPDDAEDDGAGSSLLARAEDALLPSSPVASATSGPAAPASEASSTRRVAPVSSPAFELFPRNTHAHVEDD